MLPHSARFIPKAVGVIQHASQFLGIHFRDQNSTTFADLKSYVRCLSAAMSVSCSIS
jgi:hypothetical protein